MESTTTMNQVTKPQELSSPQTTAKEGVPTTPSAYPHECPPNAQDLGRATWSFLHTSAVWYPAEPSLEQREAMLSLLQSLSIIYPFGFCATHLQKELKKHPPDVSGSEQLSRWLCDLHNRVNELLEKPLFDCDHVFARWKRDLNKECCGGQDRNH